MRKIRRILFIILLISILAFFSYRTTLSFFSDTASSIGNIFSTASIFPTPTPTLNEFYLVPRGISKNALGNWEFPNNQDILVDLMLRTAEFETDGVEAIINYDPAVLSVTKTDFTTTTIPQLNLIVYQQIETSTIHLARSIIDFPYNPPYPPIPAYTNGIIATITIHPLQLTNNSSLTFDFQKGTNNGSILTKYNEAVNILDSATALSFAVN